MTAGTSAENPAGTTLDELRKFLEICRMVEVSDQAQPTVRITLKGKIKRLEAKA